MADIARYAKTQKGTSEIAERRNTLRGRMRTMLILIDPSKSESALRQQAARLGLETDALEQLVRGGYIAALGEQQQAAPQDISTDELMRFRQAKAFMNETVVDKLGIRAFRFTLRLERCATRQDLVAMLPDYAKAIGKRSDVPEAELMVARARELLS